MIQSIIIGSSPLTLVEAALLKSKGINVLNIEAKSAIGGAWSTIRYSNIPEIEVGCHIWSYNDKVYDFLERLLSIKLVEFPSSPKILYKGFLVPYDWKANLLTLKGLAVNAVKFNEKYFKEIKKRPDFRLSIFPAKYKYPLKGAKDIKVALEKLVHQEQLKIQFNSRLDQIIIKEDSVELRLSNGESLCAMNEVVLTSLSEIQNITFQDDSSFKPTVRNVAYIHRHLVIEDDNGKPFSYIRCMGHPLIHRISDMTTQVQDEMKSNHKLICVGLFEEEYNKQTKEEQEKQIMSLLKKMKLIGKEANLVVSESNVYPSLYADGDMFDEISKRSNGKIRFLRSTDFVYSFYNQLGRYQDLLLSNSK